MSTNLDPQTRTPRLSDEELAQIDGWWRAANYLSVGQIYLLDNPLLRRPLARDDVKPRLLGHWGTTPGLNFIYAHLNRAINERGTSTIYITGPGHGGPGLVANAYLDGTYCEIYSDITQDAEGMRRLFRQFSFPGGIPVARRAGDTGLDPRGRRARLCALACVRRGFRQPGPARRRAWSATARPRPVPLADQLALQQVHQPRQRRRRAADPASQRLQDRQSDCAGPDSDRTNCAA